VGKNLLSKALVGLVVVLVGVAPASRVVAAPIVIDTTGGSIAITNSSTPTWEGMMQTFVAPEERLESWTFFLAPPDKDRNVHFFIREWNLQNGKPGAVLFQVMVPWNFNDGPQHTVLIQEDLKPGNIYAAVISLLGYKGPSVEFTEDLYSGGTGSWSQGPLNQIGDDSWVNFPEFDQRFVAVFSIDAAQIPEPGSLALIGLALLGLVRLRLVRRGRLH
jgi:hypothetical protein